MTSEPPDIDTIPSLRQGRAQSPDRSVHWVTSGRTDEEAPTILFIHGSPGSWTAWRGFLDNPELQSRARLVAVDRPGFGRSGRGRPEPSLFLQAQAAAAALDALGSPRALIVGHS